MTCASCAARIEKKLNRMPGVRASVNYATERAHVVLPADTTVEDAIGAIEATGYTAALLPPRAKGTEDAGPDDGRVAPLRRRLLVSAVPPTPVLLLAMVAPLQFDNWQWLS